MSAVFHVSYDRATTAVLGLCAAAVGIAVSVGSSSLTHLSSTAFILAASSLFATIVMSRVKNHSEISHINVAVWIALGAYLSNQEPIAGMSFIVAAFSAAVWVTRRKTFASPEFDVELSTPNVESAQSEDIIILANDGHILVPGNLGRVKLEQNEKIIDRIHIGDRVAFLRSLSAIKTEKCESEILTLLVNGAEANMPARFMTLEITLKSSACGNISLSLFRTKSLKYASRRKK
ncbi:MAG: hypothetical protein U5K75_01645 [Ahrensia sp.]|nr:hypothetical protein [Ahrensia sp.]